jgi:hypothetical protein
VFSASQISVAPLEIEDDSKNLDRRHRSQIQKTSRESMSKIGDTCDARYEVPKGRVEDEAAWLVPGRFCSRSTSPSIRYPSK